MKRTIAAPLAVLALFVLSCEGHSPSGHNGTFPSLMNAVAVLHPTEGNSARGIVRFAESDGKVRVEAHVTGLKPGAKHGFHIHELGDCSSPDGKSAGGHYNPEGHGHAGPGHATRHAGDLGNLLADDKGEAHYIVELENVTISGAHNPILGRGVIVHAGEDDLKTQPTGGAGARVACGVIGAAK